MVKVKATDLSGVVTVDPEKLPPQLGGWELLQVEGEL
jgi:hypothetical protein